MFKRLKIFRRIIRINSVIVKYQLDKILLSIPLLAPFRIIAHLNPVNWFAKENRSRGESIRLALEELGPIFVKFGQMLSTRSDLIPEDIIFELSKLQDRVPPFSSEAARAIIESELGNRIENIFANFSYDPLASASIAQVHAAQLQSGKEVIVKVLRPNIKNAIAQDIAVLYTLAKLAEKYWTQTKRLHLVLVIREFEMSLLAELDLVREAANASQLRRNFLNSDKLYVPEVYWDYIRDRVMVMERIYGIPISDIETFKRNHFDLKELAERGVEIFFTQVFRDSFFHADMHPGNIFVDPTKTIEPRYIAVDFGIMGTLSREDQRYLAENFLAFFRRDYRRVAELHVDSGWISPDARVEEFEAAVRTVCEPIFERPLKEISFGRTLMRLFQIGRQFEMEVQPQLVLLQKTLLNIEGLGRKLYPDLDLWSTAQPYLERWMRERMSPLTAIREASERLPYWREKFPEIPGLLYETLMTIRTEQVKNKRALTPHQPPAKRRRSWWQGFGLAFIVVAILNTVVIDFGWHEGHYFLILTTVLGLIGVSTLIFSGLYSRNKTDV